MSQEFTHFNQILVLPEIRELRQKVQELYQEAFNEGRRAQNNEISSARKSAANSAYSYELDMSWREQEWAEDAWRKHSQAQLEYHTAINRLCKESGLEPFYTGYVNGVATHPGYDDE